MTSFHTEQNSARILYREGVRFYVEIDATGGGRSVELLPADVPLFLGDRFRWLAKVWKVPLDVYMAWHNAGGFPQCNADTVSGRRCKNGVAGPPDQRGMVDPPEFGELMNGYCSVHGGGAASERNRQKER